VPEEVLSFYLVSIGVADSLQDAMPARFAETQWLMHVDSLMKITM
ncbi:hypothetical protein A2U01_0099548, partial [Trifolium medium]|nr:hypothetical protein [Trifolium medium]